MHTHAHTRAHICVHTHTCMHTCTHVHTNIYTHTCTRACTHAPTCTKIYARTHTHLQTHIYTLKHTHTHIHTHAHTHTHTLTHTHAHTHTYTYIYTLQHTHQHKFLSHQTQNNPENNNDIINSRSEAQRGRTASIHDAIEAAATGRQVEVSFRPGWRGVCNECSWCSRGVDKQGYICLLETQDCLALSLSLSLSHRHTHSWNTRLPWQSTRTVATLLLLQQRYSIATCQAVPEIHQPVLKYTNMWCFYNHYISVPRMHLLTCPCKTAKASGECDQTRQCWSSSVVRSSKKTARGQSWRSDNNLLQ